MRVIFGKVEEISREGLIFVFFFIFDYGLLIIMFLNYKKISWFNIGFLDMECLFIGYSVVF